MSSLRNRESLASTTDVLVLCGGLGTRFREVRQDIPKCLAPLQGKPFLDLLLSNLIEQGFCNFILATGYLSDQVQDHIKKRSDANYRFSSEKVPLGTGGALKLAEKLVNSDPFLVMNGDSFIDFELTRILEDHATTQSDVSMLISSSMKSETYGSVFIDENRRVVAFAEKIREERSSFTNAGIYCLNSAVLSSIGNGVPISLERECFPQWVDRLKVTGLVTSSPIIDIGTAKRYQAAQFLSFGEISNVP